MAALSAVLVGIGTRGQMWRDALNAHPSFDVSAVVDLDRAVAIERAAAIGVPPGRCFDSLDDALRDERIDAAVIATPHEHHVASCLTALDHGCGILVEKPFAPTVAEAAVVVRRAAEKKLPVVVGQNYRYLRATRAIKSIIEKGDLGRVRLISMQYYRPWRDLEPALLTTHNPVLWGIAPHHFDTIRYITGRAIARVTASLATTGPADRPKGATLQSFLSLDDGARVTYTATYESVGQDRFEGGREFYARIVGDRATLHVFNRWLVLARPGAIPRLIRRGPRVETEEATLLSQLARSITSGREPECSGRENLQTVAALEACVRSHEREVPVDPRNLVEDALAG